MVQKTVPAITMVYPAYLHAEFAMELVVIKVPKFETTIMLMIIWKCRSKYI